MVLPSAYHQLENFALLIGSASAVGYSVTVKQAPAGDAHAYCTLDPAAETVAGLLATLVDGQANETTLLRLGDLLFNALFVGDIATLYRSSLSFVRGQGKQLRIQLTIEPPELAALPWEFLHDAQEDTLLAISPETPLVRYVSLPTPSHPTITKPPLRVLVVIASPKDAPPLKTERERTIDQFHCFVSLSGREEHNIDRISKIYKIRHSVHSVNFVNSVKKFLISLL